jgi:hypothetical protein
MTVERGKSELAGARRMLHPMFEQPGVAFLIRLGVLVGGFMLLQKLLRHVPHLAPTAYARPSVLIELAGATLHSWLALLLLALLALAARARLWQTWDRYQDLGRLRPVVLVVLLMVTWIAAGYDQNSFFGQSHGVDRVALVGLALLSMWRPGALLAFLWLAYALLWQFDEPLHFQFSWTEINLPLQMLTLVAVAIACQAATGMSFAAEMLTALVSLLAAPYWASGWGKIQLDWLARPAIHYLLPAGYAHGWLSGVDPAAIGATTETLRTFALPLMVVTLAVECGALLVLSRRAITMALLVAWAAMHVGILAVSGIAFWKWIVVEAALGLWWWRHADLTRRVYAWPARAASGVLILAGVLWMRAVPLAWYDTPLTYTVQLQALSATGVPVLISSGRFSLYDDLIAFSNFSYLDPGRRLNDQIWGSSFSLEVAAALSDAHDLADVQAIENALGEVAFDEGRARAFDQLVRCFVGQPWRPVVDGVSLQAPSNLWVGQRGVVPRAGFVPSAVAVHRLTWLAGATGPVVIRDDLVRTIPLGPCPGPNSH